MRDLSIMIRKLTVKYDEVVTNKSDKTEEEITEPLVDEKITIKMMDQFRCLEP